MDWLAHTKTSLLNLDDIDLEDATYLIPCFSSLDVLERSIDRLGLLNPPLVHCRRHRRSIPVIGRRRLVAAAALGMSRVMSRIIPEEMPEQDGFRLAFWDTVSSRSLDAAGVAVVVKRLLELFPRSEVASEFLPVLPVPRHGPRLERLKAIGSLEPPVLEALGVGRIHEKTAWVFTKLEPHERIALLKLIENLGLNANKAAEVIENLFDLSIFHRRPILEFQEREEARHMLSDRESDRPQVAAKFRDLVRSWKFPELASREKRFRAAVEAIPSSPRITVRPAAGFESPECTVEIRCRSAEEAVSMVERIEEKL